jgi:hypothetical protein
VWSFSAYTRADWYDGVIVRSSVARRAVIDWDDEGFVYDEPAKTKSPGDSAEALKAGKPLPAAIVKGGELYEKDSINNGVAHGDIGVHGAATDGLGGNASIRPAAV